jgi:phage recombination protein Bet
MTETAPAPRIVGSALVIDPQQNYFTDAQVRVLHQLGVKDAAPADLAVFFHHAQRTGLDPFARQIYMIGRKAQENGKWVVKQTIQTGIDGFRLIARRAADRAGETIAYGDTQWCGPDGVWAPVWLADDPPAAAKVTVLRNGQPFPGVALWREYRQTKTGGDLTPMWARMPANQLAKCAEAQALRRAFPQDLSGLYTDDEMAHQTNPTTQPRTRVTAADVMAGQHANPADDPAGADPADDTGGADPDGDPVVDAEFVDDTDV